MQLLAVSFALSVSFLVLTVPLGIEPLHGQLPPYALITHALTLGHFVIGDAFYWGRFPRLSASRKATACCWIAFGVSLFVILRQVRYCWEPLLFLYFLGHFWKDVDLGFRPGAASALGEEWRQPKRWTGLLVLVAFVVFCSGFVTDPRVLGYAKRLVWSVVAILGLVGLLRLMRGSPQRASLNVRWAQFLGLAAGVLLLFAWIDLSHPMALALRCFFLLWHFIMWYGFYGTRLRIQGSVSLTQGQNVFQPSLLGLTVFIILVHLVVLTGAWIYYSIPPDGRPLYRLLDVVYDPEFRYVLGCWTVLHITWNWPAKTVKRVQVAY